MRIDQTAQAYEHLIQRFANWAQTKPDILAAFIVGSRARADHPADEWSDLDIVVVVTDPKPYLSTASWVERIGKPWLTFVEPTADRRGLERRVLFEGGLDVDFAFFPVDLIQQMAQAAIPSDVADTLRRGVRVILDRDDLLKQLQVTPVEAQPSQLPPQAEFLEAINDFWYHAVWTAKHLRRGELWWAKGGCDSHMKRLLLRMIEWHARATRGPDYDTWLNGRFLEEWAAPRVLEGLREAFAYYDEADIWRALFKTMDLFRWLAVETTERLQYPYPTFGDEHATKLVQSLFTEKD